MCCFNLDYLNILKVVLIGLERVQIKIEPMLLSEYPLVTQRNSGGLAPYFSGGKPLIHKCF